MVTEVISFFNELDILEAHLEEHSRLMDRTIIVESTKSITGLEKPLYFTENKERFKRFGCEVVTLPNHIYDRVEGPINEQYNIYRQNDGKRKAWCHKNLSIDTKWVLYSDADEVYNKDLWIEWSPMLQSEYKAFQFNIQQYFAQVNCKLPVIRNVYRLYRSDLHELQLFNVKGMLRKGVDGVMGWHFTSCHPTTKELHEKAQCKPWEFGVTKPEDVPGVEFFEGRIGKQQDSCHTVPVPFTQWSKEDPSNLPPWMASNLHLFPTI